MYLKLIKDDIENIHNWQGKPFYVFISLHNICNANCIFCDVHQEKLKEGRVDIPELITELSTLGTQYIHFIGGGEPFADKNIFNYFELISKMKMKIAVTTNGLGLNEEKIKLLSATNMKYMFFSIDSHDPAIHNGLRRTPLIWEKATENIKLIKRYMPKTKIVINHVLNRKNIADFQRMLLLKSDVPFDYLNPIFIKDSKELNLEINQIEEFIGQLEHYQEINSQLNTEFLYPLKEFFADVDCDISDFAKGMYNSQVDYQCIFPMISAYIDCPTAQVYPCDCTIHRDPVIYNCGSLVEASFQEIWCGSKMHKVRELLTSENLGCKAKCDYANIYFNTKVRECLNI